MHNRREFLKATATVTSILAISSVSNVLATDTAPFTNIVYTAETPGKWAGKQKSHAPKVTVTGNEVAVVTMHPMSKGHYIVRQTLVLEDGTYVGGTTFKPTDKPESTYELPAGYKGKIYVTSFCNLHDFWLTEVQV